MSIEEDIAKARLATEVLSLAADVCKGCKLAIEAFNATPPDGNMMLYQAVALQKALAIFMEKMFRESINKNAN